MALFVVGEAFVWLVPKALVNDRWEFVPHISRSGVSESLLCALIFQIHNIIQG